MEISSSKKNLDLQFHPLTTERVREHCYLRISVLDSVNCLEGEFLSIDSRHKVDFNTVSPIRPPLFLLNDILLHVFFKRSD